MLTKTYGKRKTKQASQMVQGLLLLEHTFQLHPRGKGRRQRDRTVDR